MKITARIVPGPIPGGCRVTVTDAPEEMVLLCECTDYRARKIRAGAVNAGLVPSGATLIESIRGRIRWALKMKPTR